MNEEVIKILKRIETNHNINGATLEKLEEEIGLIYHLIEALCKQNGITVEQIKRDLSKEL